MLSKNQIRDAILGNIFQAVTKEAANKIAAELSLAPGSVVLGEKAISITEGTQTRHVQITPDGRDIVFVDPKFL